VRRALIFDLDDTLYPEAEYCAQAFASAAGLLARLGVGPRGELGAMLMAIHTHEGRERVFDRAAETLGFPRQWVPGLVAAYRATRPLLRPWPGVVDLLARLREGWRLGILTDGHAAVQRAKLESLGIEARVDAVVVADELGRHAWKPGPWGVRECLRRLGAEPAAAILVGDNPERDLCAARSAGVAAVRLRHPDGYFARVPTPPGLAQAELEDLRGLEGALEGVARP